MRAFADYIMRMSELPRVADMPFIVSITAWIDLTLIDCAITLGTVATCVGEIAIS